MNILYIGSSSDFHIDLWVQYFTKNHRVFLFSEKENYLSNKKFKDVEIIYSQGLLGGILNIFHSKSHKLFQLNKLISTLIYARKIDQIVREKNIHIIHAHNLYQGFICSYIKSKVPVVFTPMGSDIIIHAQQNFLYKFMAKKAFKRANVVTGDSLLIQKRGLLVGANQIKNYIIQNGVDSKKFFPNSSNVRTSLNIDEDDFLIYSPRGLDDIYNIKKIIEVIALLQKEGIKVKCMISYGFGEYNLNMLKKCISDLNIQDLIIWIGSVEYDDMPHYYNAADMIISIPDSDSSPKSVYEAMFCKKPVIVSDLDWVNETLGDKDCVIKVDHKNIESIKNAVIRLCKDNDYRDRISNNALYVSKKFFDYYENMEKMESLMIIETEQNEH